MSRNPWSEKEIIKLREVYASPISFDEINDLFPFRSQNAIRIKASRLGLTRTLDDISNFGAPNMLKFSNGEAGEDYFFKCSGCDNWILVEMDVENEVTDIVCPLCEAVCRYVI